MTASMIRVLFFFCFMIETAFAGDLWRAQNTNDPTAACDNVCAWVRDLKQPYPNFNVSCCGEADRFEADNFERDANGGYIAIITNGHGQIPDGTRIPVPKEKMKTDQGNPTGRGQIFIAPGTTFTIYCMVPGGGV